VTREPEKNMDAFIVSSVRTAVGKAKRGALRHARPEELGAAVVREAVRRVPGIEPEQVDDVLIGCAFPEGPQGMNIGRIIAQKSGLPDAIPGATINRFCSSGLQTIAMATQAIAAGHADAIVAGGAESMSMVPMSGFFFQPDPGLVEGNPDVFVSMGITAENVARKWGVSREDQDRFALASHEKAVQAIRSGRFEKEIVALTLEEQVIEDGRPATSEVVFNTDEGPREDTTLEALSRLRPAFHAKGSVTAGNASQMSDGAAASVVMSERRMKELNLEPMARLVGFALDGVAPDIMGVGPIGAIRKVLAKAGLTAADIGLVELNEAFAAQAIAVLREVGFDDDTVNVNGGAIALGHPLGCTGAKLTTQLLHEMKRRNVRYGIVSMCVGGGMGAAGLFELA
jgi:acetyl-CoA acyltransferase